MVKKIVLMLLLATTFALSHTLEEIRKRGRIVIGLSGNNYPFAKQLEDGSYTGFEAKIAKAIIEGIFEGKKGEIVLQPIGFRDRFTALKEDRVDIVFRMVTVTADRKKLVDFTTPYLMVNLAVLTRKKDGIKSLRQLKDKKILAAKGDVSRTHLINMGYQVESCQESCYKDLKTRDDVYGFATDNTILYKWQIRDEEVEVGVPKCRADDYIAAAVKKGNKKLVKYVNDRIYTLSKQGYFQKVFDEDIAPFYKGIVDKKYFLLDDLYQMLSSF